MRAGRAGSSIFLCCCLLYEGMIALQRPSEQLSRQSVCGCLLLQSIAFTLSIAIQSNHQLTYLLSQHTALHLSLQPPARDSCAIRQTVAARMQVSVPVAQSSILRYFTFPCCLTYLGRTRRHASCLRSCRADSFFP